jgi:peptidoglycan/xylan/chitin deacetylase (PgdA/CDA1 family)
MAMRIFFLLALICLTALNVNLIRARDNDNTSTLTGDGTLRRIRVPILMYHYVDALPPDADAYRQDLTISALAFQRHLAYLVEAGYHTISLYELDHALRFGGLLAENPIVLTFDDGYINHYTNVYPALEAIGYTATFFIITDFADEQRSGYMTWQHITEIANAGHSIESHTKNHPDLRGRNADFLTYQIMGSIETIRHHTHQPARIFSYPAGAYDSTVLTFLDAADTLRAVTTHQGTQHTTNNQFELERLRITGEMSVAELDQLLNANDPE